MIPVQTTHLQVAALTHPGRRGKNNEDRLIVSAFKISEKDPTPVLLAVIADGVGGHQGGEVAADLAVTNISQVVSVSDASQPLAILQNAFEQANQIIYTRSLNNPDLLGMGTTCVCAWLIGDRLFTASVGDSRLYLVRGDAATQLTIDHTWVQEAIDSGLLTPAQARNHPNAHVIRRHLGSQLPVVPDFRVRLNVGEVDSRAQVNRGRLAAGRYHLVVRRWADRSGW
jgi:protein phosphatase